MAQSTPLSQLISPRSFLAGMEGYIPGEQPQGPGWIKLNTNEFPYPAAPEVLEAIRAAATDAVRVYPDPSCTPLREALAERHGVTPENILVGNGSDEILRYLAHAYLSAERRLAVVRPTYVLYATLAAMFEAQVTEYALEEQTRLPEELFAAGRRGEWAACFLPVPNPPLGTTWRGDELVKLAEGSGLVVLDGAYVDFIADKREPMPIRETLEQAPNIVFTRTFSKSFGLAGMRVGYMIARPELINELHKLRDSYNVNRISQAAALGALQGAAYYRAKCDEIIASREKLTNALTERGFEIPASQGNFIFAKHARAPELYQMLKAKKILVRYFNHSGLENGMRITIGTPEENAALVAVIAASGF